MINSILAMLNLLISNDRTFGDMRENSEKRFKLEVHLGVAVNC